jgi:hypothetical protein
VKSGRGLPHSKTLRVIWRIEERASVLECACPLALWDAMVHAILRRYTGLPAGFAAAHGSGQASGGRRPACAQAPSPSSALPQAVCLKRQAGPLPCLVNEPGPPGTTIALTRCCWAGDRGRTWRLSLGLRMGFAWASHRLRMGGARVSAVGYTSCHPSSAGTMALVVWTTLPR